MKDKANKSKRALKWIVEAGPYLPDAIAMVAGLVEASAEDSDAGRLITRAEFDAVADHLWSELVLAGVAVEEG